MGRLYGLCEQVVIFIVLLSILIVVDPWAVEGQSFFLWLSEFALSIFLDWQYGNLFWLIGHYFMLWGIHLRHSALLSNLRALSGSCNEVSASVRMELLLKNCAWLHRYRFLSKLIMFRLGLHLVIQSIDRAGLEICRCQSVLWFPCSAFWQVILGLWFAFGESLSERERLLVRWKVQGWMGLFHRVWDCIYLLNDRREHRVLSLPVALL